MKDKRQQLLDQLQLVTTHIVGSPPTRRKRGGRSMGGPLVTSHVVASPPTAIELIGWIATMQATLSELLVIAVDDIKSRN